MLATMGIMNEKPPQDAQQYVSEAVEHTGAEECPLPQGRTR
jgi:hypothetical protein